MTQLTWDEAATKVDKLADKLGLGVDAGIRDTVIALWVLGFNTRQSCEGHLDSGVATPWVDVETAKPVSVLIEEEQTLLRRMMEGDPTKSDPADNERLHAIRAERHQLWLPEVARLMKLLSDFYEGRSVAIEHRLILAPRGATGVRLVAQGEVLVPLADEVAQQAMLAGSQREMRDFTAFLRRLSSN
jgi:hypothetical protein